MKLMNMIQDMGGKPTYQFSFYEMLLFSMMIAGILLFGISTIAFVLLGCVRSPWYFLLAVAAAGALCFCLTVLIFTWGD